MTNVVPFQPRPRRLNLLPGGSASGMPDFVQDEMRWGFERAFPKDFRIPDASEPAEFHYQVQPLGIEEPADFRISARQLTGMITVRGQQVGMIQLNEWTPLPGVTDRSFFLATDSFSQETADFGVAVYAGWKIRRLQKIGPLIELSKVWMQPEHARRRLWALAVQELIRRRYANRFSLLLLNTWPAGEKAEEARLEDWRGRSLWDYRRTSLGRLAQAALGVRPVPAGGVLEDRWWCWKALSAGVPGPRVR